MKLWFQSKTVWIGIIEIAIGVLGLVADFLGKGDYSPSGYVLLATGVLTVVLRFLTEEPVSLR